MIRSTLVAMLIAAAAPVFDAAAQVAPPVPPARRDSSAATPRAPRTPRSERQNEGPMRGEWLRAPLAALDFKGLDDFNFDFDHFKFDLDRFDFDADRLKFDLKNNFDADRFKFDFENDFAPKLRDLSDARFDVQDALWSAKQNLKDIDWTSVRLDAEDAVRVAMSPKVAPMPRPEVDFDRFGMSSRLRDRMAEGPPAPWAQGDAADSVYRVAREALNRGEYRRASQVFRDLGQRYPNSAYAPDALYWEAFSLYRIGATEELRTALRALDAQKERFGHGSKTPRADVAELSTRIRGFLAMKGDPTAAAEVAKAATQNGDSCDKEDLAVRIEALSALSQMDPAATMPIIKRVLARRDECSASLRRRALVLVGRRADESSADMLIDAAKNDPDESVRSDAIQWLAKMPGDRAIATLEELARTSTSERVQSNAISALTNSDSPRARQTIRALLEKSDASESLRAAALSSFDRERNTATEDAAYLRGLYAKLESRRLKERTISAIARMGGPENDQWLLALTRNANEPIELRAAALSRVGRSVPIADVVKMYDSATERPLREQLLSIYMQRKEPEATDKLLDIVRSGTDPQIRRTAISYLTRKNDPRTTKLLMEILDK